MKKIVNRIEKIIRKSKSFLIVSHINPEGDSLGSQLAMAYLLRCLGKDFVVFSSDVVPRHYRFLPEVNLIQDKIDSRLRFDVAIALDCPNLKRAGRAALAMKKADFVINIDHHISNENFGDLNWTEKDASSAGEMVYKLYKKMGCKITKETALCLYIAILTDTGSFNYSNTSSVTHDIISELMGHGIEPYDVSKSIYENKTLESMRLLGRVLSGLKLTANGRIAYAAARSSDFNRTHTTPLDCENFVNFGRSIKGVYAALFFHESLKKKNTFHVSLRSKKEIDVNKIASYFGGGGHKSAAGCTVRGTFAEVKKRVLKRITDEL